MPLGIGDEGVAPKVNIPGLEIAKAATQMKLKEAKDTGKPGQVTTEMVDKASLPNSDKVTDRLNTPSKPPPGGKAAQIQDKPGVINPDQAIKSAAKDAGAGFDLTLLLVDLEKTPENIKNAIAEFKNLPKEEQAKQKGALAKVLINNDKNSGIKQELAEVFLDYLINPTNREDMVSKLKEKAEGYDGDLRPLFNKKEEPGLRALFHEYNQIGREERLTKRFEEAHQKLSDGLLQRLNNSVLNKNLDECVKNAKRLGGESKRDQINQIAKDMKEVIANFEQAKKQNDLPAQFQKWNKGLEELKNLAKPPPKAKIEEAPPQAPRGEQVRREKSKSLPAPITQRPTAEEIKARHKSASANLQPSFKPLPPNSEKIPEVELLTELTKTEETFGKNLTQMNTVINDLLSNPGIKKEFEKALNEKRTLYENANQAVANFNKLLNGKEYKEATTEGKLILIQKYFEEPEYKTYVDAIKEIAKDYDNIIVLSDKIKAFMEKNEISFKGIPANVKIQEFNSLTITPIQRLPRHIMLQEGLSNRLHANEYKVQFDTKVIAETKKSTQFVNKSVYAKQLERMKTIINEYVGKPNSKLSINDDGLLEVVNRSVFGRAGKSLESKKAVQKLLYDFADIANSNDVNTKLDMGPLLNTLENQEWFKEVIKNDPDSAKLLNKAKINLAKNLLKQLKGIASEKNVDNEAISNSAKKFFNELKELTNLAKTNNDNDLKDKVVSLIGELEAEPEDVNNDPYSWFRTLIKNDNNVASLFNDVKNTAR